MSARAKKSLGSDDFEEWFDDESWVDFLERRGDNAEATEKSTVENDYHVWHPLQIQVALDQLRLLNNNKSKVVRWFKANLPDSVFAKRLTRSHLVYWTTSRASTSAPKRKRGKKAALDENTELYKATCGFVRKHIDGGMPAVVSFIGAMVRSFLQQHAPARLQGLQVSDSWTRALLHANDLTPRKGTSSRKEPSDWEEQLELMVLQIAQITEDKKIPPALVIAFDHTGLQFMPVNNHTWAPVGAATVPLVALDDYRQITGVVAESMDDDMSGV
ncbi:hypothetical protein CYMTET_22909, partial [Cymbomonas tetramitiformis]